MPWDDRIIIPSKMLSQRIAAAMRRTQCAPQAWLVLTMQCLEQLPKDDSSTWQSWTASGLHVFQMSLHSEVHWCSVIFCVSYMNLTNSKNEIKQGKKQIMHSEVGEDIWRPYIAKRPLVPCGARASPSAWHLPVFTWSTDVYPFDARSVDVKLLYILSRAEGYRIVT